jgi:hypothetical protein
VGHASGVYEASPQFDNLWQTPPLEPGREGATAGLVFNGHAGPYRVPGRPGKEVVPATPDGRYQLAQSGFGQSLGGLRPDFLMGDIITPIAGADTSQAPGISPATGAFYVPSRKMVIAADHGPVKIDWKMTDGRSESRVYLVSAVCSRRPCRIFWTERPYNAPTVDLRGKFVTIHFNTSVTNATPDLDPASDAAIEYCTTNDWVNTLWVDKQGMLHARNCGGAVIVEFFQTGNKQAHIGFEIVEPLEPRISTIPVTLGSRLLPLSTYYGEEGLIPDVRKGLPDYLYHHTPQNDAGHFAGWLFAIRENAQAPWNIEVYWKHKGLLEILWPYEVDWYAAAWPEDRFCQLYIRGGDSTNAPVTIPDSLMAQVEAYMDPPKHAVLSLDGKSFYTTGPGRALLRYNAGNDVWFQVVRSIQSTNGIYFNRGLVPWTIGEEVRPVQLPKVAVFDGESSYFEVPADYTSGTTVEFWVRPARTNNMCLFHLTDEITCYQSWQGLVIANDGTLWHHASTNGYAQTGNHGTTRLQAGRWYHVAVVRETVGQMRLYVNGVQEGGEVDIGQAPVPPSVYLFGHREVQLGYGWFKGEMKEVRIWSRVLGQDEIVSNIYRHLDGDEPELAHYFDFQDRQEGDATGSAQVRDLAAKQWCDWAGGVPEPEPQPLALPRLLGFDGASSYFSFAAAGQFACTVELWIKPKENVNRTVFILTSTNGTNRLQELSFNQEGKLFVRAFTGGNNDVTGTTIVQPSDWYHVAVVSENPGKMRLYVNGVQEGLDVAVGTIAATDLVYAFGLHGVQDSHGFYRGDMGEVRLWSRALSQGDIVANMHRTLAPGEPGLLHHFTLDEVRFQPDGSLALRDHVLDQSADWRGRVALSETRLEPAEDIPEAVGYIYQSPGNCYNPGLYSWPATNSHIFAVNTNLLEVWWSIPHQQPYMPAAVFWPSLVVVYTNVWPLVAPEIVIAGQNKDKAGLLPDYCQQPRIYYQNDPNRPGYNPNEEHALLLAGQVYALRDDLNTTNSSAPYVLVEYEDLLADLRPKMLVFHVIETNEFYQFAQEVEVGMPLQEPMPLTVLPKCTQTYLEAGPAWRDRKLTYWSYAAGDDGSPDNPAPTNTLMRFYYPMQPGFYFPGLAQQPGMGAELPWLSRQGTGGTPIAYTYTNLWPAQVPVLTLGETLVHPKHGLPAISGQKSVKILYQQSARINNTRSVTLIDPTRERMVGLAALPDDIATEFSEGKKYFRELPPHLRSRLFYDPDAGRLKFVGQLVVPEAGEYYLLLNYLGGNVNTAGSDRNRVRNLSQNAAWQAAVDGLATDIIEITDDDTPFDSLALSAAGGKGTGYVTLAFGSSSTLCEPADPVSVTVIRVEAPLYRGEVKAIYSPNPLDEKLTMRHSSDFAGHPERYEFDWRYLPPDAYGVADSRPREEWISFTGGPKSDQLSIVIGGPGVLALSDNYFVCRYRPLDQTGPTGDGWSEWTGPMLAEGWIKRALNGINPFEQRIKNLELTKVNTTVSMIAQAGARYVGDVALNLDNIYNYGLIEIYETLLRRGENMTIRAGYSYHPANDALLLAAGRIHDLYMILGNEAYGDAMDPTIAYGTSDRFVYGSEAASIFCFMNQVATLLDEELALLRGRDNSLAPDVHIYPVYNRLYWNFTKGMSGGEAAYALNYNIPNANGDVSGVINEADAKQLYPQGHGDAWGHYLSAIKGYYRLLANSNFTWSPRIEGKVVGGVTLNVDYFDERKLAEAAAAKARVGADIVELVHRSQYRELRQGVWPGFRDSDTNRAWGLGEWACRAGQGAYFDWAVANSLLPDQDYDPTHTGIQKVDRTTVPELKEIATSLDMIQLKADNADRALNPLGLAKDTVPFDISPAEIDAGKTHFEQIYERSLVALNNARRLLNHAQENTQVLRRQADSQEELVEAVNRSEQDYNNRLIEIFGYPYDDDKGPGKLYPQDYDGPDLYHYQYIDVHDIIGEPLVESQVVISDLIDYSVSEDESTKDWDKYTLKKVSHKAVTFNLVQGRFPAKPASYQGSRRAQGEIQMAYADYLRAWYELRQAQADMQALQSSIQVYFDRLDSRMDRFDDEDSLRRWTGATMGAYQGISQIMDALVYRIQVQREFSMLVADAVAWGLPMVTVVGLATGGDLCSPVRAVTLDAKASLLYLHGTAENIMYGIKVAAEVASKLTEAYRDSQLLKYDHEAVEGQLLLELKEKLGEQESKTLEVQKRVQTLFQMQERFRSLVAQGFRLLDERTSFRARAATRIQTDRYADMAFRIFRSDALGKYRAAFNLAAEYVYLAAKAYDYETGLLGPSAEAGSGTDFLSSIVRTRSLGVISEGVPQLVGGAGDPGLADIMARMKANWDVLKGRLGFNNPATETSRFSLRAELFRIATPADPAALATSDEAWRNALWRCKVGDLLALPAFQRYCLPFSLSSGPEPALVIPFSTTIESRKNFFGWDVAGGDNAYDSSHFATKIRTVGVWFSNFDNAFGRGLANEPRVYLIPVGTDIMRSPTDPLGQPRTWQVVDQALPIPFDISSDGSLNAPDWIPIIDSLSGGIGTIRKYPSLRAYHDRGTFDPSELCTNARLVGRSVWNTQWLLIIPASTLHSDVAHALEWFINGVNSDGNGVKDIKILFQTYSFSGN